MAPSTPPVRCRICSSLSPCLGLAERVQRRHGGQQARRGLLPSATTAATAATVIASCRGGRHRLCAHDSVAAAPPSLGVSRSSSSSSSSSTWVSVCFRLLFIIQNLPEKLARKKKHLSGQKNFRLVSSKNLSTAPLAVCEGPVGAGKERTLHRLGAVSQVRRRPPGSPG